ncbi:M15 family metallopeptidase [Dysgonomonas sp. 511]|uniref:M15 family metallopeptidase n=1 Tax=Dysgonomonas sp. 511 TaxID=2302930 RepID=UPI0013D70113|nr:M15 family metallopeptidase [Dysgonomonas sp. 511]NDV77431.1 M15 family peptidase [Dysgonomonas sp. 511]
MNIRLVIVLIGIACSSVLNAQVADSYPLPVQKLVKAYPETITGFDGSYIILANGNKVAYANDGKENKTHEELVNSNSVKDIFAFEYKKGKVTTLPKNHDPGRIRSEDLLKKMYGASAAEVQKTLTTIIWCPKLVNQKLKVTTINGVDKQLQKVSDELDRHPELKDYVLSAGTFVWRKVRGADRLSAHSFGTAIDVSIKYSNYWQWDCKCNNENVDLKYKNRIPQLIVDIFEKYGFIWGGKWYHYDTMHFEYRPELLIE